MSALIRSKICTNILPGGKLQFSTSRIQLKSHYDTLGVTSKATQNDIKSAYYKLTKVYHPDKNKSEDAKQKFRNITDAYEILGNYKSRKMYDRGMRPELRRPETRTQEEIKKDDAQTRFYMSRIHRSKLRTRDGRTVIYDFDEWTRAHYGETLDRTFKSQQTRVQNESERLKKNALSEDSKMLYPIILLFAILYLSIITSNFDEGYDNNTIVNKNKKSDHPRPET